MRFTGVTLSIIGTVQQNTAEGLGLGLGLGSGLGHDPRRSCSFYLCFPVTFLPAATSQNPGGGGAGNLAQR